MLCISVVFPDRDLSKEFAIERHTKAPEGALSGLGVPELEAKRYEEEIKRGHIPVSVHCDSVGMAHVARKVLEDTGGKAVFLSREQRAA